MDRVCDNKECEWHEIEQKKPKFETVMTGYGNVTSICVDGGTPQKYTVDKVMVYHQYGPTFQDRGLCPTCARVYCMLKGLV